MIPQTNARLVSSFKSFSQVTSAVILLVGCSVLVGWQLDIGILKNVLPGLATMKANTALAFVLAGVSLCLLQTKQPSQRNRRLAQACAFLVILVGLLTLAEYLVGWDLGIDQLLFKDLLTVETSHPGRMAPATALNFFLIGLALLFLDRQTRRGHYPAQWLILAIALHSLVAIIGYAYGAESLYRVAHYSSVALHTALMFCLLAVGMLCVRPNHGVMAIVSGDSAGGLMVRRLLPATIFVLTGLGGLRLAGQQAGFYDTRFGLSLMVVSAIVILSALIWLNAGSLNRAEEKILHANRLYAVLSQINQTIVRVSERERLFDEACRIAVQYGLFRMAWIGLMDSETQSLEPVAHSGIEEAQVDDALHSIHDEPEVRRAIREGQRFICNDVRNDPRMARWRAEAEKRGYRSLAAFPIRMQGRVVGAFNLYADEPNFFNEAEIKLLEEVTQDISFALDTMEQEARRKRAEELAQHNLERIRALHEIDLAITSTLDLSKILDVLLEKIEVFVPIAAASTVRLLNRETGDLESLACRGFDEQEWRSQARAVLGGRAQRVVETRAPVVAANIHTDERTYNTEIFRKRGLISYLGVPLIAHDKVLGVLSIYTRQEREFSKEETDFLNTLAGQAAIAIDNAQLFEKVNLSRRELELTNQYLERSMRQLSGLYTALGPLAPSETIGEMMDGIIERLTQATGADAALIRLHDKEKRSFYWASQKGFPDYYLKAVETPPAGSSLEHVFNTGEPIIAPDIATDPRLKGKVQLQVGLRSCAMLPLKVHNEVQGIVHLASSQLGYFDEEQRDHLMALARQLGIALENKELFDNLKASRDELDKANKVKDQFLSVMSHELRTPLSIIMGYTGLVKDGMLGPVNDQQEDALKKVLTRTGEQLNMINDIMQTTQIESRSMAVEHLIVDISALMDSLKRDYKLYVDKPAVGLVWDYPSEPIEILSDGAKLKQILQNLINNALKFTDTGTVTVSVRVTGVRNRESAIGSVPQFPTPNSQTLNPDSRFLELTLADTGVGIAEDQIAAIFDKFYQVDSSETRLFGGVGLGLFIVRRFTDLLGGKVEVESEPGKGSTFTVAIPLEP